VLVGKKQLLCFKPSLGNRQIYCNTQLTGQNVFLIGRSLERLKKFNLYALNETMIISEDLAQFSKYEGIVKKYLSSLVSFWFLFILQNRANNSSSAINN
jgi:hypothetical protein